MALTKRLKQTQPPRISRRLALILSIAGTIIGLALIIQSIVIYHLYQSVDDMSSHKIGLLISDAASERGRPAVIEPLSGKRYLPDIRLVLPVPPKDLEIVYDGDFETGVAVADTAVVRRAAQKVTNARTVESVFDWVPNLQACTRQLELTGTERTGQEGNLIHTKTLTDGRALYIYENMSCGTRSGGLLDYIKQVDSY